jgi:lysozyme family protein
MATWPKDNQEARNAFYGDPGKGEIERQMVPVTPPFAMYYEGKRVNTIRFHKKCAPALLAALNEIWDYCQHDQAKIDASGASKFFGAYNPRKVRGSETKWSNHAYAAAIDLNAGQNALGKVGNMPDFIVDAFVRQGAMWGGWYKNRPDWMHFEFVDNGGRQPKSARPVPGVVEPVTAKVVPTADRRTRMGRVILGYEARRDKAGHLAVYKLPANDGGGTYEVGGINDRYHPVQAAHLRDLIATEKFDEAEASAAEYLKQYTDAAAGWSTNAGVEFFLRDCVFNRGPTGAAKILQMALGVGVDGTVGTETRDALAKIEPGALLEKLRAAREAYEDEVAGPRPNLRKGLINRWNNALADAKKFAAETPTSSQKTADDLLKGAVVAGSSGGIATGLHKGWSLLEWVTYAGEAVLLVMVLYLAWRHGWPMLKAWLHRDPTYHDKLLDGAAKVQDAPGASMPALPPARRKRAPRKPAAKRRGKGKPAKKPAGKAKQRVAGKPHLTKRKAT